MPWGKQKSFPPTSFSLFLSQDINLKWLCMTTVTSIFFVCVNPFEVCGVEPMNRYVFSLYMWPLGFLYSSAATHYIYQLTFTNSLPFLPKFLLLSSCTCLRDVSAPYLSFIFAGTCLYLDFRLVLLPVTFQPGSVLEHLWQCRLVQFVGWLVEECKQCFYQLPVF